MHCGARAGQNHKVVVLEAVIERSAGSTLSHPNIVSLVTVKYLTPFTTSISTPITSAARLYKLSTGGVYLKDGNNPDFCLLLTAQHDVASSDQDTVQPAPHQNLGADVSFYDDSSFTRHLETIQGGVTTYESTVELFGRQMRQKTGAALQTATEALEGFKRDLETLKELREKLQEDWADPSQRVLGQVYCHSPLDYSAGEPRYTEDSALVAADGLKLDDREPSENLVNYQEWASRSSKQSHRDRFDPPLGTLYGSPFLFCRGTSHMNFAIFPELQGVGGSASASRLPIGRSIRLQGEIYRCPCDCLLPCQRPADCRCYYWTHCGPVLAQSRHSHPLLQPFPGCRSVIRMLYLLQLFPRQHFLRDDGSTAIPRGDGYVSSDFVAIINEDGTQRAAGRCG